MWTDSKIVLHWIKNNPRIWKTFVQNRVEEIEGKASEVWNHCHGCESPADKITRENHRDSESKAIYTDGSKMDEGTGSAYCILEINGIIASWQGKLHHNNSVFQDEILGFKKAIEAASSLHRPIKIWTDRLSSLLVILNPKYHHSIVREIQTLLLSQKDINLRWLKAHVGYFG
ncbi:hypothetical protein AVEN_263290-1 [Araneus ventricosus]|uniref:Uncharacterized protein n=1 Tax=Araneus ventricosus TaxID=182803 RepID=A0A4Y2LBS0_ARAVE|nr:hypothetical protein AVEN_263290-1 [Araneus ventricosus]